MSLADNILIPYTVDELLEKMLKAFDKVNEIFPGLVVKVREWMKDADFKAIVANLYPSMRGVSYCPTRMRTAPLSMKMEAVRMAGLTNWWDGDGQFELVSWLCDYLWKEAGLADCEWHFDSGGSVPILPDDFSQRSEPFDVTFSYRTIDEQQHRSIIGECHA